ncbi:MAG TPA: class I SAM-dependent methyltransferase [Thermodesulfovibrionia bacterium]|nr:class I SAM-dependent methyltransferase [Thermodesulfovibrionia bacterium]
MPFFNADSPPLRHFCLNVCRAESLDDVYNVNGSFKWKNGTVLPDACMPDFWAMFHLSSPNAQAVRNRYRIVKEQYKASGGGKTLSIACGSAQPLLHGLHDLLNAGKGQNSAIILTDSSMDSLHLAKKRAQQAGLSDRVSFVQANLCELTKKLNNEKFDVIEACGILDYLNKDAALKLMRNAFSSLNTNGSVILSNMMKTGSADLLSRICNWNIVYRSPEEFENLILEAGGKNVRIYSEPWKIHAVAVVKT